MKFHEAKIMHICEGLLTRFEMFQWFNTVYFEDKMQKYKLINVARF